MVVWTNVIFLTLPSQSKGKSAQGLLFYNLLYKGEQES